MRPNEKDGLDYHFVSREQFQELIDNNELLEWENVYGNFYGVPRQPVRQALSEGKDTIIKIDVQGASTIKKNVPQAIFIFLVPQTMQELIDRLTRRNTESEENLRLRIATAEEEMKKIEMFDYVAINEHGRINTVVSEIRSIITAEKMRITHREYKYKISIKNKRGQHFYWQPNQEHRLLLRQVCSAFLYDIIRAHLIYTWYPHYHRNSSPKQLVETASAYSQSR
jgi:guanylate kinase